MADFLPAPPPRLCWCCWWLSNPLCSLRDTAGVSVPPSHTSSSHWPHISSAQPGTAERHPCCCHPPPPLLPAPLPSCCHSAPPALGAGLRTEGQAAGQQLLSSSRNAMDGRHKGGVRTQQGEGSPPFTCCPSLPLTLGLSAAPGLWSSWCHFGPPGFEPSHSARFQTSFHSAQPAHTSPGGSGRQS